MFQLDNLDTPTSWLRKSSQYFDTPPVNGPTIRWSNLPRWLEASHGFLKPRVFVGYLPAIMIEEKNHDLCHIIDPFVMIGVWKNPFVMIPHLNHTIISSSKNKLGIFHGFPCWISVVQVLAWASGEVGSPVLPSFSVIGKMLSAY